MKFCSNISLVLKLSIFGIMLSFKTLIQFSGLTIISFQGLFFLVNNFTITHSSHFILEYESITFRSVQFLFLLIITEVHLTHAEISEVLMLKKVLSKMGFNMRTHISQSSKLVSVDSLSNFVKARVVFLFNLITELSAKIISASQSAQVIIESLTSIVIQSANCSVFVEFFLLAVQIKEFTYARGSLFFIFSMILGVSAHVDVVIQESAKAHVFVDKFTWICFLLFFLVKNANEIANINISISPT
ncbi:MAG: hypothetical protein ACD_3C00213G0010 [uncultured bacterium (gcode 4)]|uniref:Uncharacterized protein n=1 Tax=uncultured bacterium (gcode 4) TaxID=1234023 RepID=K2F898_9BACT|nr:MAG: hypothetical protein ACD_3C00213G0010 [uncultured bacterium (gcode 4)]